MEKLTSPNMTFSFDYNLLFLPAAQRLGLTLLWIILVQTFAFYWLPQEKPVGKRPLWQIGRDLRSANNKSKKKQAMQ